MSSSPSSSSIDVSSPALPGLIMNSLSPSASSSGISDRTTTSTLPTIPPSSGFLHQFPTLSSVSSWTSFESSKTHVTASSSGYQDSDKSTEGILRKLVWQAGLDEFGRPIICFSVASIPDSRLVDLDRLFRSLVLTLQSLVRNDYILVIFAAGGNFYPPFSWVWKVWAQLGRPFRKNLKQLFVVHPTFKIKTIFTLVTPLVSPKVFRKIVWIQKLSVLFSHIPIANVLVPPETVRENLAREPSYLPSSLSNLLSSTRIPESFSPSGQYILPAVIQDAVQYLRWGFSEDVDYYHLRFGSSLSEGLSTLGIFRKNPSSGIQRCVEEAYLADLPVSLTLFDDPHLAAGLIKWFFRKLREPLFGESIWDLVMSCPSRLDSQLGEDHLRNVILGSLEPHKRLLLGYVIYLLHDTTLCNSLMTSHNLSIVFTPNLIRSSSPARDMLLASVEPSTSLVQLAMIGRPASAAALKGVTLGLIVAHWIERPEVFWGEEVRDFGRGSRVPI